MYRLCRMRHSVIKIDDIGERRVDCPFGESVFQCGVSLQDVAAMLTRNRASHHQPLICCVNQWRRPGRSAPGKAIYE